MDHVTGVSWPRSGHHLLVRLLNLYFGDRFLYCDFYGGIEGCCKTLPCTRADVHLSKSHDFDLGLPQVSGRKYLVQYRDFIPSIVSNWELFLLGKPQSEDTADNFFKFASGEYTGYQGFVRKWVESDFAKDQLIIHYDQITAWPRESLRAAAEWIDPDNTPDEAAIEAAVASVSGEKVERWTVQPLEKSGVHASRAVENFRHYDPTRFSLLARFALRRDQVVHNYRHFFGDMPSEDHILRLQTLPDAQTLRERLNRSDDPESWFRP